MSSELPKIDRWNSEPLDVHTWSDHPEVKALCDLLQFKALARLAAHECSDR